MIIQTIETERLAVPLTKPFKTALRTVAKAESIVVKITCDNGVVGYGEAPPTHVITGESLPGIEAAIHGIFKPLITGSDLLSHEAVFQNLHSSMERNTSAKAAIDIAIYDCLSRHAGLPLYRYLGGFREELETDFTVSVNGKEEMGQDAVRYTDSGFRILKVKLGKDSLENNMARLVAIREAVGPAIIIRIDANQAWSPKEAVNAIRKMEDLSLDIELVEQPVAKEDIEGLKAVTDSVDTLIMADESVFSPQDAFKILQTRSADLINIKLMKSGGIRKALLINQLAESCGVECMVGSMIESRLGITAAAHLAASQKNITRYDFDAPLMLKDDPIIGGVLYRGANLYFDNQPGLGISGIKRGGV
ncbi:MAG: dipeptide epimerase [Bacillus sp. (in: firmicutes)]